MTDEAVRIVFLQALVARALYEMLLRGDRRAFTVGFFWWNYILAWAELLGTVAQYSDGYAALAHRLFVAGCRVGLSA